MKLHLSFFLNLIRSELVKLPTMKYQHLLWDWNGTILDDAWLCVEIMNEQLAQHQLPQLTLEKYAEVFRFPVRAYYQDLGFDFEITPFEQLSDAFIAQYEIRKFECPIRPETLSTLEGLAALGLSQSIVSASSQVSLHQIVQHYGLSDHFDAVRGLDNHHAHGKLEIGREWMSEGRIDPASVLLCGDTLHDHELAEDLGINCVLIYSGHQNLSRLQQSGVPILSSLADLLDRI